MTQNRRIRATILLALASLGTSISARSQIILDIAPPGAYLTVPTAINSDGSVVVGYFRPTAASQDRAFRWSTVYGFEDLGSQPCHLYSQATCVSADGNVIGGYGGYGGSASCGAPLALAFRWTRASGMTPLPWGGVAPCGGGGAAAYGISGDGTVMVGQSNFGCYPFACTWIFPASGAPEFRKMNFFDPVGNANAISGDGHVAFGAVADPYWACRWQGGSPAQPLSVPGVPRATNSDGTIMVGNITKLFSSDAYRFTNQGIQLLGSLSSGGQQYDGSYAQGLSGDGNIVVGESTISFVGTFAFLWSPVLGMVNLNTYLPTTGIDLTGWTLGSAKAVSADGTTIVGVGSSPSGQWRAWRVTLGPQVWTNLGSGVPGVSGIPVLAGTGTLAAGSSGSLSLTSAKASSPAMLFVSLGSTPTPFMGGILVPFPVTLAVGLGTDGNGALLLPFTWPPGVLPATSLYFQCAVLDPAGPLGVSLSNALNALTP